jgi:hypothetical protein
MLIAGIENRTLNYAKLKEIKMNDNRKILEAPGGKPLHWP